MGGSDQWGNIVNGIELTRRLDRSEVFGLTSNLLTTSDGKKMGKTQSGAIWINNELLSSFDFWQFWRNTDDKDVLRFLKLFTTLRLDECERLGKLQGKELNEAKIILATEVTNLAHGLEASKNAKNAALNIFNNADLPDNLPKQIIPPLIPNFSAFNTSKLSLFFNIAFWCIPDA